MFPGTNMAAAGKEAGCSKERLVDMRTWTEARISARGACRDTCEGGTRSLTGNHGNRGACCRPGCL